MDLLLWILVGVVAGFLAEKVTKTPMGLLMNLLVGLLGAFVGGFLFSLVGADDTGGSLLGSIAVATVGAIVLLLLVNAVRRRSP